MLGQAGFCALEGQTCWWRRLMAKADGGRLAQKDWGRKAGVSYA